MKHFLLQSRKTGWYWNTEFQRWVADPKEATVFAFEPKLMRHEQLVPVE